MDDEHIADLTPEQILELAEVDLAMEEILRSLDESLEDLELSEVDRALIIQHVRWAYLDGWTDRHNMNPEQLG